MEILADIRFNQDFRECPEKSLNYTSGIWKKRKFLIKKNILEIELEDKIISFTIDSFLNNDIINRARNLSSIRYTKKNRIDFVIKVNTEDCKHNYFILEMTDESNLVRNTPKQGEEKKFNTYRHNKQTQFQKCLNKKYNFLSISTNDDDYTKIISHLNSQDIQEENFFLKHSKDTIMFEKKCFYIEKQISIMYDFGGIYAINEYKYELPIFLSDKKGGQKYKNSRKKSKKKKRKIKKNKKTKVINKSLSNNLLFQ